MRSFRWSTCHAASSSVSRRSSTKSRTDFPALAAWIFTLQISSPGTFRNTMAFDFSFGLFFVAIASEYALLVRKVSSVNFVLALRRVLVYRSDVPPHQISQEHRAIQQAALDSLLSKRCACGSFKAPRMALCGPCYGHLTRDQQQALWQKIGHGFEEALRVAVARLKTLGRIA